MTIGGLTSSCGDRPEAGTCITISERLSVNGGRNFDVNISKRNTPDQDALIQLAKEASEFLIDNYIGRIGLENKVPMNCYPIGFLMIRS